MKEREREQDRDSMKARRTERQSKREREQDRDSMKARRTERQSKR